MTKLITPAQAHDKKYPKLMPDYPTSSQTSTPTTPTTTTTQSMSIYTADKWQNPEGGQLTLPNVHYAEPQNFLSSPVPRVNLDIDKNFHPTTGLCIVRLVTSSNFDNGSLATSFWFPGCSYGFNFTLEPSTSYTFVFAIANYANGEKTLIPVSITEKAQ